LDNGDTVASDEAQVAIDTAEVDARAAGERYGFLDCGQFLDAGEGPGDSASGAVDTGTGTAPATGGVAPTTPAPVPTEPAPVPTEPAPAPPADDSGGITP
jgi:hypothetical protein